MNDEQLKDHLCRVGDMVALVILTALPVGIVLDLTIVRGQIPNGLFTAAWIAFLVWAVANDPRTRREHAATLRSEALERGLVPVSIDEATFPMRSPLLTGYERPKHIARTTVDGLDVFVFEQRMEQDHRWYDDESSDVTFAVCVHELPGDLARFHIEIGTGHTRFRDPWPKPRVSLSGKNACDPVPDIVEAWLRDERTSAFFTGLGFPCQIRIDGGWVAMLTSQGRRLWPVMEATRAFVELIPPDAYRPAGGTRFPAVPSSL